MAKEKESERDPAHRALAPWRPSRMWGEMDRMFDEFRREMADFFGRPRTWMPGGLAVFARKPAVDIEDAGTSLVVTAEVPGISKEDLNLNVTDDAVEIRSETKREREERAEGYVYRERGASSFYRYVSLPVPVNPDNAEARLEHGVLRIELPKREPTRSRRVKVD